MSWLDSLALLIATAAAGMIAGSSFGAFLSAALAAAAASWRALPALSRCRHVFVNLDPHRLDPDTLPQALRYALDEVTRTQKPMLMRISPPYGAERHDCRLDINREYDMEIRRTGLRTAKLGRKNVWIAEHPLPLILPDARAVTLRLSPAGQARVRVAPAAAHPPPCPISLWLALTAAAAAACLLNCAWLLAAALGFAFQTGLLVHFQNRLPADSQI
ncbi:MAG: hypothetical protein PHU80_11210 [Kiritimatiellae bacterium]|nr:hypothetical protein [Kiritimatiellia bacterium]